MDIIKTMEEKICNAINVVNLNIADESVKHANHYFSSPSILPSHVGLILISDDFVEMSILERHKLIYKLLNSEIEQVHGISLQLNTQSEYNSKNKIIKA
ncbi:MAG: BolA family protein [Wolbachia sp.]